jgi:hypothetical protein
LVANISELNHENGALAFFGIDLVIFRYFCLNMVSQTSSHIDSLLISDVVGSDQNARPREQQENAPNDFPVGFPPPFTPSQQEVRSIPFIVVLLSFFHSLTSSSLNTAALSNPNDERNSYSNGRLVAIRR